MAWMPIGKVLSKPPSLAEAGIDKNLAHRARTAAEAVADCLIWDQTHDGASLLRSAASTVAASFKPKCPEAIRRRARST